MDLQKLHCDIEVACIQAGSKLSISETNAENGSLKVHLTGGINGHGEWKYYFRSLSDFCDIMYMKGYRVVVDNLVNDMPDDVFDCIVYIDEIK
jgi:hypothetical protein